MAGWCLYSFYAFLLSYSLDDMFQNTLLPDPVVLSSLASAINDSRLRFLSLASNNQLGDAFVEHFLRFLRSRHLHELHISAVGLTSRSAPVIGSWISGNPQRNSDGVCHLQIFKSSGNSLGVNGVWEIVRAIERGNWGITKVEVYANQLVPSPALPDTGSFLFCVTHAKLIYWACQKRRIL